MRKATGHLAAWLCLALLLGGCGGGGRDTGSGTTTAGDSSLSQRASAGARHDAPPGQKRRAAEAGGSSSGLGPSPSKTEVAAFKATPGTDDSVQTFGKEVDEAEAEEVVLAMRSFLRAVAVADYAEICADLTSETVEQAEDLARRGRPNGCPATLKTLMAPRRSVEAEITKAARGVIYQVRIEDDTAFILFTPRGGVASFFVMQREGSAWKSTGLSPGAPLNPESEPG